MNAVIVPAVYALAGTAGVLLYLKGASQLGKLLKRRGQEQTTPAPSHAVTITSGRHNGRWSYRAVCTCGWQAIRTAHKPLALEVESHRTIAGTSAR